jgi:hypothetical protein
LGVEIGATIRRVQRLATGWRIEKLHSR